MNTSCPSHRWRYPGSEITTTPDLRLLNKLAKHDVSVSVDEAARMMAGPVSQTAGALHSLLLRGLVRHIDVRQIDGGGDAGVHFRILNLVRLILNARPDGVLG